MGRQMQVLCIIINMNKYAYQIQGVLENRQGKMCGLRVMVCNANNKEAVDVPVEVLDSETVKFLQFRLSITAEPVNITTLPIKIQNQIRAPLGRWLDHWVLENFYGNTSNRKSINT